MTFPGQNVFYRDVHVVYFQDEESGGGKAKDKLRLNIIKPYTKMTKNKNASGVNETSVDDVLRHRLGHDALTMKRLIHFYYHNNENTEEECHEIRLRIQAFLKDGTRHELVSKKIINVNRHQLKIESMNPSTLDGQGFLRCLTVKVPSYKVPVGPNYKVSHQATLCVDDQDVPRNEAEIYVTERIVKEEFQLFYEIKHIGSVLEKALGSSNRLFIHLKAVGDDNFVYGESRYPVKHFIEGMHGQVCEEFSNVLLKNQDVPDRIQFFQHIEETQLNKKCENCHRLLQGLREFKLTMNSRTNLATTSKKKRKKFPSDSCNLSHSKVSRTEFVDATQNTTAGTDLLGNVIAEQNIEGKENFDRARELISNTKDTYRNKCILTAFSSSIQSWCNEEQRYNVFSPRFQAEDRTVITMNVSDIGDDLLPSTLRVDQEAVDTGKFSTQYSQQHLGPKEYSVTGTELDDYLKSFHDYQIEDDPKSNMGKFSCLQRKAIVPYLLNILSFSRGLGRFWIFFGGNC